MPARIPWTDHEDRLLLSTVEKTLADGKSADAGFAEAAELLPRRTKSAIQYRYYVLRRTKRPADRSHELSEKRRSNVRALQRGARNGKEAHGNGGFGKPLLGRIVWGEVTKLAPFGAFVRLESGEEALLHATEIASERRINPGDYVAPGDRIQLKVIKDEIVEGKRRINVSAKQVRPLIDRNTLVDQDPEPLLPMVVAEDVTVPVADGDKPSEGAQSVAERPGKPQPKAFMAAEAAPRFERVAELFDLVREIHQHEQQARAKRDQVRNLLRRHPELERVLQAFRTFGAEVQL